MAIPNEYTIEGVVRKINNMVVYRADHPIHGTVIIYMPDDAIPPEAFAIVKRDLYKSGVQMRCISQLCLPFVTKTLEVSQNPNEPYIITEYSKYDLEKLINEGVKLKPKRIYQIFLQVLEAIMSLSENGWQTDRLEPYQIQLSNIHEGDVTITALLSTGFEESKLTDTMIPETEEDSASVFPPTQTLKDNTIENTQTLKNDITIDQSHADIDQTLTLQQDSNLAGEKERTLIQRNIYILGSLAYQLLFGEKYHLSDSNAVVNISKLSAKWRAVLDKALSPSLEDRYESYEAMLCDISRALSRNKRIAITIAPLIVLLLIAGGVLGYKQYHRHKIMSSEAGQAIKNFLDIVNKTNSEFPTPYKLSEHESNDDTILRPFDEITNQAAKDD